MKRPGFLTRFGLMAMISLAGLLITLAACGPSSNQANYPDGVPSNLVTLTLSKSGPAVVAPGVPIVYSLWVSNTGAYTATGLIVTDTLPGGAHYVSGGRLAAGKQVTWSIVSLAGAAKTRLELVVTATHTLTNSDYRVTCAQGQTTQGQPAIVTRVESWQAHLPLAQHEYAQRYDTPIPVYTYTLVNTYPHDPNAFTQGLIFTNGEMYEGTGLWGRSSLRQVEMESGRMLKFLDLPAELFGEGIALYDDKIVQLTWKSQTGFVYDRASFKRLRTFSYPTEGWGITYDGHHLIMSDGTATLYFWAPDTLKEVGRIEVYDDAGPVVRLNELEYVQGEIYANVWQTNRVARINPNTGQVLGWIHLDGLLKPEDLSQPVDVLNGIAYDAQADRLFVTGKLWPKLFEIRLVKQP